MIGPKVAKPTAAEERAAYALATERDNDTCQRCLRNCGPINRDHRRGRGVGGRTVASNLQLLGGSGTTGCHGWKTTYPADAIAEGWAVPGGQDPAEWPARRWVHSRFGFAPAWVLYDDVGGFRIIADSEAEERGKGWI